MGYYDQYINQVYAPLATAPVQPGPNQGVLNILPRRGIGYGFWNRIRQAVMARQQSPYQLYPGQYNPNSLGSQIAGRGNSLYDWNRYAQTGQNPFANATVTPYAPPSEQRMFPGRQDEVKVYTPPPIVPLRTPVPVKNYNARYAL